MAHNRVGGWGTPLMEFGSLGGLQRAQDLSFAVWTLSALAIGILGVTGVATSRVAEQCRSMTPGGPTPPAVHTIKRSALYAAAGFAVAGAIFSSYRPYLWSGMGAASAIVFLTPNLAAAAINNPEKIAKMADRVTQLAVFTLGCLMTGFGHWAYLRNVKDGVIRANMP